VHMVNAFGHVSINELFFPHMAPISELLEDPYTLDEVVIEVVKQMQKAPISALEPHVGMLVRVLERNWAPDMELHRYVGAFLQRLPMHWLAPYFSHIMRAWNTTFVRVCGQVDEESDDDDEEKWTCGYSTEGDFCLKMEADGDNSR